MNINIFYKQYFDSKNPILALGKIIQQHAAKLNLKTLETKTRGAKNLRNQCIQRV